MIPKDKKLQSSKKPTKHRLELLDRYLRRSACAAAAGLGAFGLAPEADAGITVVDPADFGVQPGPNTFGWVAETYGPYAGQSFGIDILQNGGALEVGIFRGYYYGGYLIARTDTVGYAYPYGNINGSGQLGLLNNAANPDPDGPASPTRRSLDGFNAGEIIGDGDTPGLDPGQNVMRDGYSPGDWQGVPEQRCGPILHRLRDRHR